MNPAHPSWQRLIAAAQKAPSAGDTSAPYGFSTRVVALAFADSPRSLAVLSPRIWLRAFGVACILAVGSVAANYSVITSVFTDEPAAAPSSIDDPVAEVVDMAS